MKNMNKSFCYVKDESVYIYTSSAKKFGDKMLQSYSYGLDFFANRAIYGAKDSWRF